MKFLYCLPAVSYTHLARLILQVHDELIVEAPEEEAPLVQQLLTEEMEQAIHLSVPMVAEATIGKTWYDAKA